MTTYRPSPRPVFDGPALITRAGVTRHVWGDEEAGQVADWIYASTGQIHCLLFGVGPGGSFRHSPEFRTVFGADEALYVLEGEMLLANPETGEVVRVPEGEWAFFREATWHHAFAAGDGPLRVLEFFAPPPSTGASGAYARTRPYLDAADWRYGDDARLGSIPLEPPARVTLRHVAPRDLVWRLDHGVPVGLVCATEHLTAGILEVGPGQSASPHVHGGDEVVLCVAGALLVRAFDAEGGTHVFELGVEDAAYIPAGCRHEYRNVGSTTARALLGVAPSYLPAPA